MIRRKVLIILTTDPERIQASRVVNNIFPKHRLIYKVCSQREFKATLDLFYGGGAAGPVSPPAVSPTWKARWTICSTSHGSDEEEDRRGQPG